MIVVYIFDRQGNVIGQFQNIIGFSCNIRLNDTSTGEVSFSNEVISGISGIIKENNRISVYRQIGSEEKLLIEGYIRGFDADFTSTTIRIEDKFSILEDKIFYSPITFNGTVYSLLETIITTMNAREDTGIRLECNVYDTISKTFNQQEVIGSAIKDIRQNKYEFIVRDGKLKFKTSVGIDRSVKGDDYLEFNWDYLNAENRTIKNAKVIGDIKQMTNCSIGKTGNTTGSYEDSGSIQEFGRIERPFVNSGSVTDGVKGYVEERKDSIREYDISPISSNFWMCDVGDTVKVYINSGNDLMYYNGTMKVIEKSFKSGDLDQVTIKVGKGKIKTKTMTDELKDLKQRTSRLEYGQ